jgi:hypothetical protein
MCSQNYFLALCYAVQLEYFLNMEYHFYAGQGRMEYLVSSVLHHHYALLYLFCLSIFCIIIGFCHLFIVVAIFF